jgi:hypothetical protein
MPTILRRAGEGVWPATSGEIPSSSRPVPDRDGPRASAASDVRDAIAPTARAASARRHLKLLARPSAILRLVARLTRSLPAALCACSALGGTAYAGDPWEFWPELSGFVQLSPVTRVYFDAPYAAGEDDDKSLDLAAYLDISLKPIRKHYRQAEDWQRSRYAWLRIGYDHAFKATGGTRSATENRGIISLLHKYKLPADMWLEGRGRVDFRWIDGNYSTRYRFRLEATREFTLLDHTVVPYFNVEWGYDTRYDGWARTLYQAGPEVTVNEHFRYELYLARQVDHFPSASSLNAFGVVAKWYY